jgi:hypothetical protein
MIQNRLKMIKKNIPVVKNFFWKGGAKIKKSLKSVVF